MKTPKLLMAGLTLALACLTPSDTKSAAFALIQRFDNLPRQGGAVLFTSAQDNDPGLTR